MRNSNAYCRTFTVNSNANKSSQRGGKHIISKSILHQIPGFNNKTNHLFYAKKKWSKQKTSERTAIGETNIIHSNCPEILFSKWKRERRTLIFCTDDMIDSTFSCIRACECQLKHSLTPSSLLVFSDLCDHASYSFELHFRVDGIIIKHKMVGIFFFSCMRDVCLASEPHSALVNGTRISDELRDNEALKSRPNA